jgi:Ca-activated chloride channel family protein
MADRADAVTVEHTPRQVSRSSRRRQGATRKGTRMAQSSTSFPNGSSTAPSIELRPEWSGRPSAGGAFHLLLSVTAPHVANPAGGRPPVDLAFIVDRSGSMAGDKLALVKRGVEHALRLLDERDTLSLTVYDDRIDVPTPQRRFSPGTHDGVRRRLRSIEARGSTNLAGGWLTGCDQLAPLADGSSSLRRAEGRPLCRALLLTDGLANVGITEPDEIAAHSAELFRRGITTTTFGVGDDFDEVLLGRMADAGGGRYHYIAGAADIPRVFAGELGELLTVALRDVTVSLSIPAGWQLSLVNDLPLDGDAGRISVRLGDLVSRDERRLVFEATLPATTEGTRETLDVRMQWSDPSGLHTTEQTLRRVLEARSDAGEPDQQVQDELARMYGARARAEALAYNRAGRYDLARAATRHYAEMMPASPVGVAQATELSVDEAFFSAPMSPEERKARHFTQRRQFRQQKDHAKEQ